MHWLGGICRGNLSGFYLQDYPIANHDVVFVSLHVAINDLRRLTVVYLVAFVDKATN